MCVYMLYHLQGGRYLNCIVTDTSVSALNCYLKGFSLNWFTYKTMWTHCNLFEVRLMSVVSGFIIIGVYLLGGGDVFAM